ncbi:MAG: SMC family ATPase, partial [Chloroflexota bacterium]
SYRQTAALDFTGLQLATISGANGAGKSSILDGVTWALFGQARVKSDDDVVNKIANRDGEAAEVRFEFELDGQGYRVIRQKKARKAMSVEFQAAVDVNADKWSSMTMAKRRETDQAISDLLNMNYDTFSNASFLLQGRADEFTTKSAGGRKEVLADLLGVSVWDNYKAAVTEKRKLADNEQTLIDGQISEIELELTEETQRREAFESAEAEHGRIKQLLADGEVRLTEARRSADLVAQQKQTVDGAEAALRQMSSRLSEWQNRQTRQTAEREELATIVADEEKIRADHTAWELITAELEQHQERANAYNRIDKEMEPHKLAIARERSRLTQEKEGLEKRKTQLDGMAAKKADLLTNQEKQATGLAESEQTLAGLAEQDAAHQAARDELQRLESDLRLLEQEREQLNAVAQNSAKEREQLAGAENAIKQKSRDRDQLAQELEGLTAEQEKLAQMREEEAAKKAENELLRPQMVELKEKMDRLQNEKSGSCPFCGQALTEEHIEKTLAQWQAEGKKSGDQFRANKEMLATLAAEIPAIDTKVKGRPKTERQLQTLERELAGTEQTIGTLRKALAEWEKGGQMRLTTLKQEISAFMPKLEAQKIIVQEAAEALKGKSALERKISFAKEDLARIETSLAQIERDEKHWEEHSAPKLAEVSELLESDSFLADDRAALEKLTAAAEAVGYDFDAHQAQIKKRDKLADVPEKFRQLEAAVSKVASLDSALTDLAQQITEQEKLIAGQTETLESGRTMLAQLQESGGNNLALVEREVGQLREQEIAASRKMTQAQTMLDVLGKQRERLEQKRTDREEVVQKIARLRVIEKATGRDGIQALLIERALPEIEQTANDLLEKLTSGRMRVEFDTQRELKSKKGESAETLDIRISDEAGVRPYENYSGGEQFRVNFAIRIALSQVLSRRAGAKLQTLVIDEGFGSQDPEGRQKLIEAINAIQPEFALILIITHVEELRDAFPNRIEVEKTKQGSMIAVN